MLWDNSLKSLADMLNGGLHLLCANRYTDAMYQNISRQYRPQTFGSLVGQEPIVTTLKNAVRLGKIAPAYLFCGCRGTGKTTVARLFAKALNCQELQPYTEPCNHCPCCVEINQGRCLDVLEIDGASNRGIDDIRQINETVMYANANSRYKIYIIDEVHMLTKEAFNALLKTLEEPPSNVKFFFATTEPQKVLPTILSRCQRFDLKRLSSEEIAKKLHIIAQDLGRKVEPEAIALIAQMAEGGLRDAESIFDQLLCFSTEHVTYASAAYLLGVIPRHFYFTLDQAIECSNLSTPFQLSAELFSTGKELHIFLEGLLEHFRTHLLLHFNIPLKTFLFPDEEAHYKRFHTFFSQEQLLYMLDYLMGWVKEFHKIPFKRITLEMIFLHLVQSTQRISLPSLVRRLEDLYSNHHSIHPRSENAYQLTSATDLLAEQGLETRNTTTDALCPIAEETSEETSKRQNEKVDRFAIQDNKIRSHADPHAEHRTDPSAKTEPVVNRQETRLHQSRYDTILRFAAVELEGILKKE